MASPMNAEEVIVWGDTPPCQVELEPPLDLGEVSWNANPSKSIVFEIGDCQYMIEYYSANQLYNNGYAFFIAGIYKLGFGNPEGCPDVTKEEVFATAMANIIKGNIYTFPGDPDQGTIFHFFQGSCVEELARVDPNGGGSVDWRIKMEGPSSEILPSVKPFENFPSNEAIQEVCIGNIQSNEWYLPIHSGWRVCKGVPCCRASYLVMLHPLDKSVQSIVRTGDVIFNESFDCDLGIFIKSKCQPNCNALFDSYFPPPVEFYDMKIYPSPASNLITLQLPGLPPDNYQIQIIDKNGVVIHIFYMNLDEITDLDISQFSLDPGPYWIRIIKNGKPIALCNFQKY